MENASVTFSYTFTKKDVRHMEHVAVSLEALRFCFDEVFLIVDVPRRPGDHARFVESKKGAKAIRSAQVAAAGAAELLQRRCAHTGAAAASHWVKVLDYDDPELRAALLRDYSDTQHVPDFLGLRPPDRGLLENPKTWLYSHTERAAVPSDAVLRWPSGRYVFHADADVVLSRGRDPGRPASACESPGFVEVSLALMRSDERVCSTSPPSGVWVGGWERYRAHPSSGKSFEGRWPEGQALAQLHNLEGGTRFQSTVDTRCFLMDLERFRGLFPLSFPKWPAEEVWSWALRKRPKAAFHLTVDAAATGVFYRVAAPK